MFQVFLKYLYTGKITVDYANVIPILQVGNYFRFLVIFTTLIRQIFSV